MTGSLLAAVSYIGANRSMRFAVVRPIELRGGPSRPCTWSVDHAPTWVVEKCVSAVVVDASPSWRRGQLHCPAVVEKRLQRPSFRARA